MRKKLISLALIVVMTVVLCSCAKENTLSVEEDIIRVKIDESRTIKVTQTIEEQLAWTSGDSSIVTVSPEGTVTGIGAGITTVTARTEDKYVHIGVIVEGDEGYFTNSGEFIPVFDGTSNITEIVVGVKGGNKNDVTVRVGDSHQLKAYTTPSDSTDLIVWQSADSSIARVDAEGKVQIIQKGVTTVTAYAPNGVSGKIILRCK